MGLESREGLHCGPGSYFCTRSLIQATIISMNSFDSKSLCSSCRPSGKAYSFFSGAMTLAKSSWVYLNSVTKSFSPASTSSGKVRLLEGNLLELFLLQRQSDIDQRSHHVQTHVVHQQSVLRIASQHPRVLRQGVWRYFRSHDDFLVN